MNSKSSPSNSTTLSFASSLIRNICILAHVDHGKTTLVDCLLASNGIITDRMAGKLRYMDSRPDEQQRGITMKSSSIALIFKYDSEKKYLINVIDSPGHVDFFGEVSTALRVCDGCIIVVDVIEGVCSQTRAVLQQAWLARVRPILVLNKIDRLFLQQKMTTLEIYLHLAQTLEQVNACVGELFASEVLSKISVNVENDCDESSEYEKINRQIFYDWSTGLEDIDDSGVYFSPENNNVIFASAIDSWGFTISDFANILSEKLKFSNKVLQRTLWGDYYINSKEKKIIKGAQSKAKKNLFVSLVLDNLARIYEKFVLNPNKDEMIKIAESLQIKLSNRDIDRSDNRIVLKHLFNNWIPLSKSLLRTVCDIVPSPCQINEERIERLLSANRTRNFDSLPSQTRNLKQFLLSCDSNGSLDQDVPLIVYVNKMLSYSRDSLPENRFRPLTSEEMKKIREKIRTESAKKSNNECDQTVASVDLDLTPKKTESVVFIGFARVFCGTLKKNQELYVIGPKHDPSRLSSEIIKKIDNSESTLATLSSDCHVTKVKIKNLYILMGRELVDVDEVRAGNICGIGDLEAHIFKSATLSSTVFCPPFIDYHSPSVPILRVAVEPKNPSEMPILIEALRMLNQADPCVEVIIQETGEHVIASTGEVHLERCIVDLVNFLGEEFEFNISDPIVPFRETIIDLPKFDTLNENLSEQKIINLASQKKSTESIEQFTPNKKFLIKIRAKPLPESVTRMIESNREILDQMMQFQRRNFVPEPSNQSDEFNSNFTKTVSSFRKQLVEEFQNSGWSEDTVNQIWSFGPKFNGSNVLINQIPEFMHHSCFIENDFSRSRSNNIGDKEDSRYLNENSFINGFQMCTQNGPLCDEPIMGVCFIVEEWKHTGNNSSDSGSIHSEGSTPFGPISGQIMSTVKETCRRAMQAQPQRLMAAMFKCVIQINSDVLGK
ncbi:elongation factor Tu GTP-binding domain-containing protein 1-like protein [Sarcoptes scabiei]|uniref:Elongation factor Tu GTP-binding domain-containing protein 1-like protein n=1 Tax=Sarcoptes scabiei TaxID=52283 RepID=A0A132A7X5_SARSC|nr:elongation factor Tu GTP-binding domain-containing protein 1-like protein [Sarcoptes scabiei]